MVQKLIKNKLVIITAFITLILGGAGGYFLGQKQATSSNAEQMNQFYRRRFDQNMPNQGFPNQKSGTTDDNTGATQPSDSSGASNSSQSEQSDSSTQNTNATTNSGV
ncbi:hypothetical protein GHI93_08275 [Lactococcus hircilactis]|uniref:Uncharacterized protein n=1 Tax=Lactococcus hircilactis TaxID=1494462 RepID=A0A7X2D0Y1_9LACT|nr:hypothetical protein [Lactococcus hircilactis]MQW39921.1 hypothetical protein [Lactococcus hircilactis]